MSFRKAMVVLVVAAVTSTWSSQAAIAGLVIDSTYFKGHTFSYGYKSDLSYYNSYRLATGTNPSSTSAPTQSYDFRDPYPVGVGYAGAALTSDSITLSTFGASGPTEAVTPIGSYSYGDGYVSIDFHVTQDTPFMLVDTTDSLSYNYIYLYGSNGINSETLAYTYGIGVSAGIVTGTLHAGYSYIFQKESQGYAYLYSSGRFDATAGGSGEATLTINAVPEPSSLALLGLGAVGSAFGAYRRRRIAA